MSYVSVAPGSPEMLGALTRLAPVAPVAPISPIVSLTRTQPLDLANRRPAVQPPAAPPGAGLPPPGAAPGADAGAPAAGGADGDADAGKKFPIIPVAVGVAVLAFLLMRR